MVLGGGVFEMEFSRQLHRIASLFRSHCEEDIKKALGMGKEVDSICMRNFGDVAVIADELAVSFENIIVYLAANAGMDGVEALGKLRSFHDEGEIGYGLDVTKGIVCKDVKVEMPFGVQESAVVLAGEFAFQVLKINDIIT